MGRVYTSGKQLRERIERKEESKGAKHPAPNLTWALK
jgi:hypothetical protein